MKKTINDLKISDIVYKLNGTNEVLEIKISSLSQNSIGLDRTSVKLEPENRTQWLFKDSYGYTYYLNKIDALESQKKCLENSLKTKNQYIKKALDESAVYGFKIIECQNMILKQKILDLE